MKKKFLLSVIVTVTLTALIIGRYRWFFRSTIIGDVRLVQVPFEDAYDIYKADHLAVRHAMGWIVCENWLVGSSSGLQYFAVDIPTGRTLTFRSLSEMNAFLVGNKMKRYDINDEENVAHLKYDGGRRRKY